MKLKSVNHLFRDPGGVYMDSIITREVYGIVNSRVWGEVNDILLFDNIIWDWIGEHDED